MIKSEKRLAELRKVFDSGSQNGISERIKVLREEEPLEGAIELLALLYEKTNDIEIKHLIEGILNDVKERSVTSEVMDALSMPLSDRTRTMLAASCWQSGLDYSSYAGKLADIYITSEYNLALECFTVLENCADNIVPEDRAAIIKILEDEPADRSEPLKQLTRELISLLRQF